MFSTGFDLAFCALGTEALLPEPRDRLRLMRLPYPAMSVPSSDTPGNSAVPISPFDGMNWPVAGPPVPSRTTWRMSPPAALTTPAPMASDAMIATVTNGTIQTRWKRMQSLLRT